MGRKWIDNIIVYCASHKLLTPCNVNDFVQFQVKNPSLYANFPLPQPELCYPTRPVAGGTYSCDSSQ